jgi:hypothetical protein
MSALSTRSQTGWSLVKGPVAIIGVLGIAFGVAGLIFGGHSFTTATIPHGTITGKQWLGIEVNGWSNLLFIGAGLLLLLGSTLHWGAKTSAFVVAGVLGAAAIIAVIRGNGIFGIFAANHRTEIVWGGAAIVLVVLSMLPRVGARSQEAREPVARGKEPVAGDDRVREASVARDEPVAARRRVVEEEPVTRHDRVVGDDAATHEDHAVGDDSATYEDRVVGDDPVARDGRDELVTRRAVGDAPVADGP